jgi:hypothetical protein
VRWDCVSHMSPAEENAESNEYGHQILGMMPTFKFCQSRNCIPVSVRGKKKALHIGASHNSHNTPSHRSTRQLHSALIRTI